MGCLFSCSCCNRRKKRVLSSELVCLGCFFVTVRNCRISILRKSLRIAIVKCTSRVWSKGRECWLRSMNVGVDKSKCEREYQAARKVVLEPIQIDYGTVASMHSLHRSILIVVLYLPLLSYSRYPLTGSDWLWLILDCRHTLIELLIVIHGQYGLLSYPLLLPLLISLSGCFQDYEMYYVSLSVSSEW